MSPTLEQLEEANRDDLSKHWQKHYNSEVPKGLSLNFLKLSAAYYVQARRSHGKAGRVDKALNQTKNVIKNTFEPGCLLVREWHGKIYKVEVLDKGFLMNGQAFKSLSQIACHITGAKWSGPRFFGLGRCT